MTGERGIQGWDTTRDRGGAGQKKDGTNGLLFVPGGQ